MTLSYYVDVHVPAAVTEGLRRRGIDVFTSQEDGTREAEDELLLRRATMLGRVLFSQDQDLLAIAANWQANNREFSAERREHRSTHRRPASHCHVLWP